jgi:hypothetical protein
MYDGDDKAYTDGLRAVAQKIVETGVTSCVPRARTHSFGAEIVDPASFRQSSYVRIYLADVYVAIIGKRRIDAREDPLPQHTLTSAPIFLPDLCEPPGLARRRPLLEPRQARGTHASFSPHGTRRIYVV